MNNTAESAVNAVIEAANQFKQVIEAQQAAFNAIANGKDTLQTINANGKFTAAAEGVNTIVELFVDGKNDMVLWAANL